MKITICNRWTGVEIFSLDEDDATIAKALLAAIKSGANLSGANLSGADLYGANLSRADLSRADLSGANLYGANLSGANLYGANLSRADLSRADLSGADLSGADLSRAKIDGEGITIAPLALSGLRWWVLVTDNYMRIGCQRHTHAQWTGFCAKEISDMDSNATEFWSMWKAPLLTICEQHALNAAAKKAEQGTKV